MLKGIDVSNWQGNIDFEKVKATGIEIVYMKSSQGQRTSDAYFEQNYENAKKAGLKVGFYHFLEGDEDGASQAEWMYTKIKDKSWDCKIAIDAESNGSNLEQTIKDFDKRIKELTNSETVLYTYTSFINEVLDESVNYLPLWIAEYGVSSPNVNRSWIGWQYSEEGNIDGCPNGNTDLDYFTEEIFISKNLVNTNEATIQEKFSVGKVVKIIGDTYATGETIPSWVKDSVYPIIQIGDGKCLLGNGLMSWVNDSDLTIINFVVGSRVKIVGNMYSTGQVIPAWVKESVYTIQQINDDKSLIKEIESWVYTKDLILVE